MWVPLGALHVKTSGTDIVHVSGRIATCHAYVDVDRGLFGVRRRVSRRQSRIFDMHPDSDFWAAAEAEFARRVSTGSVQPGRLDGFLA